MSDTNPSAPKTPNPFAVQFGDALKRAREDSGQSMADLARRMQLLGWENYRPMTVSRTEAGTRSVHLDEAIALANTLNIPLDLVAGMEQAPGPLRYRLERDVVRVVKAQQEAASSIGHYLDEIFDAFGDLEDVAEFEKQDPKGAASLQGVANRIRSLLVEADPVKILLDQILGKFSTEFSSTGLVYAAEALLDSTRDEQAEEIVNEINEMTTKEGEKVLRYQPQDLLGDGKPLVDNDDLPTYMNYFICGWRN